MPGMDGRQSPHRWNQVKRLPLLPTIQTLEQYEEGVLVGSRDALAFLRGIDPLLHVQVADIRHVHREIFQRVHPWAGQCRTPGQMTTVAGYPSADPQRIVRELELALFQTRELLDAALASSDLPATLAAVAFFHVRFERVHPFLDGNGRCGRAILAAQIE